MELLELLFNAIFLVNLVPLVIFPVEAIGASVSLTATPTLLVAGDPVREVRVLPSGLGGESSDAEGNADLVFSIFLSVSKARVCNCLIAGVGFCSSSWILEYLRDNLF